MFFDFTKQKMEPTTQHSTTTRAKGKMVKGGNRPKRPTSAYLFFVAHCRREAIKAGNYPAKSNEFAKLCGEKWRSLTDEDKKPFVDAADEDKKRYVAEMAQHRGKTDDTNKPKRPPTAYFIYLAEFRIKMADSGLEPKVLMAKAGEDWRHMSAELKKPYEDKALEEFKNYEEAMAEYRKDEDASDEDDDEEEEDDDLIP